MASHLADAPGHAFAQTLLDRALKAGADEAQVNHSLSDQFEVNFDTTDVTLLRSTVGDSTTLTVFQEGKKGAASFNGRAEEEIETAIRTSLEAAASGVPDDANCVAETASRPATSHGPDAPDREAMLDAVMQYIAVLGKDYPTIRSDTSIYSFGSGRRSFVNSKGVHQEERRAAYSFGSMFGGKDGEKATSFNYTGAAAYEPFPELIDAGTVRRLLDEIVRSFEPRPVPQKFVGDVIVTPDCMSTLIGTLVGALNGYALMAGTTPYKDRKGEHIASSKFSLLNRPTSAAFPNGADFDGFGIPTEDLDVIVDGMLNEFLVDFYISKKLQMPMTAGETNFIVPGGDRSIDEIIANTERGIVLSRFSGGSPNNNLDFSGVAKNSFYVENGEIQYALIETMVAGNFQELLKNIRALSRETVNFGDCEFPYLAAGGVTISGK